MQSHTSRCAASPIAWKRMWRGARMAPPREEPDARARGAVRLVGAFGRTEHDDDDAYYARVLGEACAPGTSGGAARGGARGTESQQTEPVVLTPIKCHPSPFTPPALSNALIHTKCAIQC